jgi:hypothetical protein
MSKIEVLRDSNHMKGKIMKRAAFLVSVVLITVFTLVTAALASWGDVVMKEQKADVLVTIEVPDLEVIFKYVDTIMSEFDQDSSGVRQAVVSQLFKVADPKLVDFGKPVELIVVNPKKFETPVILGFSVTDRKKFLEEFGGEEMKLNPETKDAKVKEYTWTETEFDHDAYMKDLETEKDINFEDYNREVTHTSYLTLVGNMAIAAADKDLIEKAIASAGKEFPQSRLVAGDLHGTVNMDAIMSIYSEELTMMKGMMVPPEGAVDAPFDFGKIMEAYLDGLISLADSTEALQFAASVESKGDIGLQAAMLPKAGTGLASFITKQKPKPFEYLAILPEDSAMAFGWNLDFTEELVDGYIGFVMKIMDAMQREAIEEEEKEKMAALIRDYFDVLGTGGAVSMGFSDMGFDVRGVYEIEDRELAMKSVKESLSLIMGKWMKPLMEEAGADFDLKYQETAASYKGVNIDKLSFDFSLEEMPEEAKEMMKKVWGEEPSVYMGFAEKAQVMGFGAEGLDAVKETIDALSKPLSRNILTSETYNSATSGFPEEGLIVFYMSLGNLMKGIMAMAPEGEVPPGGDMMMQMFDKINLAGYVTRKDDAMVFGTRLPVSDFLGVWKGLMMGPVEEME